MLPPLSLALTAALAVSVLGRTGAPVVAAPAAAPHRAAVADTIALLRSRVKHVFVIYQENRSFDSYFGTFPGADGLYAHPAEQTAGFQQPILNLDGSTSMIRPFRIGPHEYAADTDDIDHAHSKIVAKMDVGPDGAARMDRFAMVEEAKYVKPGEFPSLAAKQMGELALAHEDCDTIPFLWQYAKRFVLFDRVFQEMTGPSTPGNLAIIGAQTGESQWLFEPDEFVQGTGDGGAGVPVLGDADPFWGSPKDTSAHKMPVNANDYQGAHPYDVQFNLTYPTLPLTLAGTQLPSIAAHDTDRTGDYKDIDDDIAAIGGAKNGAVPWGWYEEGYATERGEGADPLDAEGRHASYVTHHNGPQYFGYVANNDAMRAHLHNLGDLWNALSERTLPAQGVFYVKGGYRNIMGLRPADPDAKVQANFLGDDDHPAYSDAQISEAMVAETVNAIARSPYWKDSAIVITWDDSEGNYDHVPPPNRATLPIVGRISDGPRVPLIVISPFAKTGVVDHDTGDTASVVKLVDTVFGLTPLASLPDEQRAAQLGRSKFGVPLGARDGAGNGISTLVSAFDERRLRGTLPPLTAAYATIDEHHVHTLPGLDGYGCKDIGIRPTDALIPNPIPADFNPRPRTNPT